MNKTTKILRVLAALNVGLVMVAMPASKVFAEFVDTKDGIKYENSKGEYYKSKLAEIDGSTYYFNKDGIMQTGFVKLKKGTFYFDKKGVMQTGLTKIDNTYYYFSDEGKMVTGTVVVGKKYVYTFGQDGKFKSKADGWVNFTSGTYYCVKGEIQKGFQTISDNNGNKSYYYFGTDGKLVKDKNIEYNLYTLYIDSNGEIYYIDDNTEEKKEELKNLRSQKASYEEYIEECDAQINEWKGEQSKVKSKLDTYKQKVNNERNNGSRLVYSGGGSWSQKPDYDKIADYQFYVDLYQDSYDEYADAIKEVEGYKEDAKAEIKKIDKRISELTKEFEAAGIEV